MERGKTKRDIPIVSFLLQGGAEKKMKTFYYNMNVIVIGEAV